MAFEFRFFDLDFRNTNITTQSSAVDTFFQANDMEWWDVGENEVMFGVYNDGVSNTPTRFTIFDAGVDGIKANIATLNTNTALLNFVAANQVIKTRMVENRIVLVQYVSRT